MGKVLQVRQEAEETHRRAFLVRHPEKHIEPVAAVEGPVGDLGSPEDEEGAKVDLIASESASVHQSRPS